MNILNDFLDAVSSIVIGFVIGWCVAYSDEIIEFCKKVYKWQKEK